jgi:hypothetical protein
MTKAQYLLILILIFPVSSFADENKTTGLKKVNYANETADIYNKGAGETALSPEQAKQLLKDIETIKARQAESQKILDELDKDE